MTIDGAEPVADSKDLAENLGTSQVDVAHYLFSPDTDNAVRSAIERVQRGVGNFAADMRAQGIHVGLGASPRCVTCDQPWPCSESGR